MDTGEEKCRDVAGFGSLGIPSSYHGNTTRVCDPGELSLLFLFLLGVKTLENRNLFTIYIQYHIPFVTQLRYIILYFYII